MTDRQRSALHEAGHVIVGRALGCAPTSATVETVGTSARGRAWFAVGRERRTLKEITDELAVDLAGATAVALAEGTDWSALRWLTSAHALEEFEGQYNSRREILEDVADIIRPTVDHDATAALEATYWYDRALPRAAARAARILERDWSDVLRLADRLDANGRVEFAA